MIRLLDCTLRDGGYITNWVFGKDNMSRIINDLTSANLDMVEIGYLNQNADGTDKSMFKTIEDASQSIPKNRGKTLYLAMVDVGRFLPENIVEHQDRYIDGIRVAFYKHQMVDAMTMCRAVVQAGYKLFIQPMVTADYSETEYKDMIAQILEFNPYAVYIVDSFGYMTKEDVRRYWDILDAQLTSNTLIGFHAHNNMQVAFENAQSLFEYKTNRDIIIDSSLYGMGRAAGNLKTERIISYYNQLVENKYDMSSIMPLIEDIIYPIYKEQQWGYSQYYFLTAKYRCHPGYAIYLLGDQTVAIDEFEEFLKTIDDENRTKCIKQKTLELFKNFKLNID